MSAGDVRGVVVHTVARMMALGGAGDVVVSATVRDVLDGTGLALRGLWAATSSRACPGERQLYRSSSAPDQFCVTRLSTWSATIRRWIWLVPS